MESKLPHNAVRPPLTETREIVDESDVYVDVHKAIRRLTPAPRARQIEAAAAAAAAKKTTEHPVLVDITEDGNGNTIQVGSYGVQSDGGGQENSRPRTAIFMKRRSSAGPDGRMEGQPEPTRSSLQDVRQQLRLGPANRAARPLSTRKEVFKTKQGLGNPHPSPSGMHRTVSADESDIPRSNDETTPLLDQRDSEDEPSHSKTNGDRS